MTLEALDQHLSRWQKSVATVVANVYELYEHPVYRALAESTRTATVPATGTSRQRVEHAVEAVRDLLLCGTEMQGVVERAGKLRQALPLLFREEKIREIDLLLHGPSIQMPATDIPLMQRPLLSDAAGTLRSLSIQQMLDAMTPDFEAAKQTIFEVDRAWATLCPRLEAATAELAGLRAASLDAGLGDTPDLLDLQRRIDAARTAVQRDPLGAAEAVEDGIMPALAQARTRWESIAAEQRQTRADLVEAHQLQNELQEVHARAASVTADRQLKVSAEGPSAPMMPLAADKIEDARGWLEQLDGMMADPATRQRVRVGVRRWLETARQHLAHEQAAARQNQTLLDERLELRGRLDALVAKAAGSALAEDPVLAADAQAARALLYQRPTPLQAARDLVTRYQAQLNKKIASPAH